MQRTNPVVEVYVGAAAHFKVMTPPGFLDLADLVSMRFRVDVE